MTLFRARGAAHWIPEVDSRNLLIGPQLLWLMARVKIWKLEKTGAYAEIGK